MLFVKEFLTLFYQFSLFAYIMDWENFVVK